MNVHLFYHSLVSDWNHGNAHFLRGIAAELLARGHSVTVYEPADSWSRESLLAEHGTEPLVKFAAAYPTLVSTLYDPATLDLDESLGDADLVIVHEWNDHELVARIGALRRRFVLLFHDTHHRLVSDPEAMRRYELGGYDGVLAFGRVLRDLYLRNRLTPRAWTWHEAADVRQFHPLAHIEPTRDLVWIGNWGDDERSEELHEFLIEPVAALGLSATVFGVRYPEAAKQALRKAGISYHGWLPNFEVPKIFANHRVTIHVPRRPYVASLPGIPTIRPFEAMACAIPLVCAPWNDCENLFSPGRDFLTACDGAAMRTQLAALLADPRRRAEQAARGLATIHARHTCGVRVDELLAVHAEVSRGDAQRPLPASVRGLTRLPS
jgi:spore maturation protein CgeB